MKTEELVKTLAAAMDLGSTRGRSTEERVLEAICGKQTELTLRKMMLTESLASAQLEIEHTKADLARCSDRSEELERLRAQIADSATHDEVTP